jgi:hypothetical protein
MFRGYGTLPICELHKLYGSVDSLAKEGNIYTCVSTMRPGTHFSFLVHAYVCTHTSTLHSTALRIFPEARFLWLTETAGMVTTLILPVPLKMKTVTPADYMVISHNDQIPASWISPEVQPPWVQRSWRQILVTLECEAAHSPCRGFTNSITFLFHLQPIPLWQPNNQGQLKCVVAVGKS